MLDPALVGTRCEVCTLYLPPLTATDEWILELWRNDQTNNEQRRRDNWRRGGRDD